MKSRFVAAFAATALAVLLAGCTGPAEDSPPEDDAAIQSEQPETAEPGTSEATAPGGSADAALTTVDSPLGEIVVDGEGMTVYMFDSDTQGGDASTCEGQCAQNWPAVTTESNAPSVEGVTGEVATITGIDGSTQVTLNGWPLYYYIGDEAAGDTNGQGVGGVWWVLSPAGEKIGG
jgi:predicted lipoprotein with Yx(FWY)xxD motif